MQIGSQLPHIGQSFRPLALTNNEANKPKAALPVVSAMSPSSQVEFASEYTSKSRFTRIDSLDFNTQNALSIYELTQSMASNNPRNSLIGVDVYA